MRALIVLVAWLVWHPYAQAGAEATVVAVVVNMRRVERLDRADVARVYLRTRRFWNDGSPIVPLNLEVSSPVRTAFTTRVLALDAAHLAGYWNEQYFHGVFPPTVLSSAAAVKRYVASDDRAIGYVDAREVDDTVRVVLTIAE